MEPPALVPLLLLNLADAKNPSGTSGRVLCVCYETENRLFDDQQQAHFEFALCGNAVQAVLIEAEALACVQFVILTLIANNGLAFEGGQDGIAGSAVRSQAGALVKSHQDKFHVVCMSDVQIGDAALFIRNEVLQFGGLACLMILFMVKFSFFKMISV